MEVSKFMVGALSLVIGLLQGIALFLLASINTHLGSIDVQLARNTVSISTMQVESAYDRQNLQKVWTEVEKMQDHKQ